VGVYRLWILAESRIHLKDFELTETELNEVWSDRVKEHKELEEKVRCIAVLLELGTGFRLESVPSSTRRSANIGRKCTLKHVLALVQYPNRCS